MVSSAGRPVVAWDVSGNAAAVVLNSYRAALFQDYGDAVAGAGHRLVYAVVHYLVDQVMQAAVVGAAYVHAGTAAYRLQAFQDLDIAGSVLGHIFNLLAYHRYSSYGVASANTKGARIWDLEERRSRVKKRG